MRSRTSELPERLSALFPAPRRFRRAVGRVAAALGLAIVFGASFVGATLLHVHLGPSRRVARVVASRILGKLFRGTIRVGEIDALAYDRIEIRDAQILDPDGQEVIRAHRVAARFSTLHLLRSLAWDNKPTDPIWVAFPTVQIEDATVSLLPQGGSTTPTIAETFLLREPPPPSNTPGRPVILTLPRIELAHVAVRGLEGRPIDAKVQRLVGSVGFADRLVMVDVEPTGLVDRAYLPAETSGVASYHLRVDTDAERIAKRIVIDQDGSERHPEPVDMWMDFSGAIGKVPVQAAAELEGSRLAAKAELSTVTPEAIREIFPPVPLARPASVEVRARGLLPELRFGARVHTNQGGTEGSLVARGVADLRGAPRLEVEFASNELDPRDLSADLPEAHVSGRGVLRIAAPEGDLLASLEATTLPTLVENTPVPAIDLIADLHGDELVGSATVDEPGAPIDARFDIGPTGRIAFGLRAESEELAAAPRVAALVGVPVSGGAIVTANGTLEGKHLAADVVASVGGIGVGSFGAARAYVNGHVEGPLSDLTLRAGAQAEGVAAFGRTVDHAKVDVAGPIARPIVSASIEDAELGSVDARASVSIPDRRASNVAFTVSRAGATASGKVASVQTSSGGVDVRGIEIEGPDVGTVRGALRVEGGDLVGSLRAEGVHLDKVGALVGLPARTGGVANLDVAVERVDGRRRGHLEVEVQGGQYWLLNGIAARLSAKFDGDRVETAGFLRVVQDAGDAERQRAKKEGAWAEAQLCDGPIAELVVSDASGTLEGPLLSSATWKHAVGQAALSAENVNLRCVLGLVPSPVRSLLPVAEASGLVTTRARIVRRDGDPYPSVEDLYLKTHGLALAGSTGLLALSEPSWESRRIDVELRGGLDGTTGRTSADATLLDGALLADVSADLDLSLDRVVALLGRRAPGTLADELERAPLSVHVEVPQRAVRELDTLPSFLKRFIPPIDGDIRIEAALDGSVAAPAISASVHGYGIRPSAASEPSLGWIPAVDTDVSATYSPDSGRGVLEAHVSHEGVTVASVNAGLDAPIAAILHPNGQPVPWKAGAYVSVFSFPLETIAPLAEREVSGHVTGTLAVSGIHETPSVKLSLSAPDLKLGGVPFDAELAGDTGKSDGATLERAQPSAGTLHLGLDGGDAGKLGVDVTAWLKGLTLDATRPGDIDVRVDKLDLAAFTPLVTPFLTRIGGTLDGEVVLHMDNADLGRLAEGKLIFPTPRLDRDKKPRKAGLTIRDAVVLIPQLGQELQSGVADITETTSDAANDTHVRVKNLEARGTSGRVHGGLDATFHGLAFDNASGTLVIDKGEELPITFEGVPLGLASGTLDFKATHPEGVVNLAVKVPIVRFDLPSSSSRNVQDLAEDPTIHTKEQLSATEAQRGPNATHYHLDVELDRGEIGGGFEAVVKSSPSAPITVDLADKLTVGGDVVIDSGSIELQKKKFEVERGLVRLRAEEAGNPYVNLTARWDGPDGGRVYVDYVGTLKPMTDDKIRFRSDPPRSKEDIIATLLFGTDLSSTPQGGTAAGGAGLAAGVTSTLASQALKSLVSSKYVTLSVDTTTEGGLRGTVEWRASQGLTLGVSGEQVQAQQATATSTGQVAGAQGEVSLEWKFLPNWSLRSSFGAGVREPSTGLDVLWQYNY